MAVRIITHAEQLTEAEIKTVVGLHRHYLKYQAIALGLKTPPIAVGFSTLMKGNRLAVYDDNGSIVGYCLYKTDGRRLKIKSCYVSEPYRRKGIMSAIHHALYDNEDFQLITLALHANCGAAKAFYEKAGYSFTTELGWILMTLQRVTFRII